MEKYSAYATVKFVGNGEEYISGVNCRDWLYCHQCPRWLECREPKCSRFVRDREYRAFFLDFCAGVRNVLEVEDERGEVQTHLPLSDFCIISDGQGVLCDRRATVRCIAVGGCGDVQEGKCYIATRADSALQYYYVLDESNECYWYPKRLFTVESDPLGILS